MAGEITDFKIYQNEFWGGLVETVEQSTGGLLENTNGAVNVVSINQRGEFEKESFFKDIEGLVTRRDPTSVADVADLGMSMGEVTGVKLNTRISNTAQTLDSFRKIGEDPSLMSFSLGQMYGKQVALDMVNSGLVAAATAMSTEPTAVLDVTAVGGGNDTMSYANLVKAMAKMGDQANRIKTLVMPSASYFALVGESIAVPVSEVAGVSIYQGTIGTMGKNIVVLDSPALINEGDGENTILLLTEDAITINQSEDGFIGSEIVYGKENLMMRIQGESAFTVTVKGYSYTGSASPSDSQLSTGSNWVNQFNSVKSGPGIALITK